MARYRILATIVSVGFGELQVTVSAIPEDMRSAETRSATVRDDEEAIARRDFLVMSLATELRARGHEVAVVEE